MKLTVESGVGGGSLYRDMYCRTGFDYEEVEMNAHFAAVERLALDEDGNALPYLVKMSVHAAEINREREVLEFRKYGGRLDLTVLIQADVIVFESQVQKDIFEQEGYLVFNKR